MRINVIIPFDGLGGGMRITAGYCNNLAKRGHQVRVLPGRPPKTRLGPWRNFASRIGLKKIESYFDWNLLQRIDVDFDDPAWRSRVPDGDILICTWWSIVELCASLPSRNGNLVQLIQGDDRVLGQPHDRVLAVWRLPSIRVAVSGWIAQIIRQDSGVGDIHVIRNPVDTAFFDSPVRPKNERPVLGYIFSPHECKGSDTAAEVIERVRREIPNLNVVCFGSIRPRFNGVRPPDGVKFIHRPAQRTIPSLYASCDVWLSTSRSEGSCLPPQEAMACRTPAVMTSVGDLSTPGMFGNGGVVVPIGDVDALVDKTLHVLRLDARAWAAMSQESWSAIRRWSWDQATDAMEKILAPGDGPARGSVMSSTVSNSRLVNQG
jgi:glycosyltransferase involved in cell wall biosynthesis